MKRILLLLLLISLIPVVEGQVGVRPFAKVFTLGSITVDAPATVLISWEYPLAEPIKKNIVSSAEYYEDESDFYYSIRVNGHDVLCDVNLDLNWGNTSIQFLNVTVIGTDLSQTNSSATKENAIISFILRTNPEKEIPLKPPKTNPPPPFTIPPPPTDEEQFRDDVATLFGSIIGVGVVGVFAYYLRKITITKSKRSKK